MIAIAIAIVMLLNWVHGFPIVVFTVSNQQHRLLSCANGGQPNCKKAVTEIAIAIAQLERNINLSLLVQVHSCPEMGYLLDSPGM